MAFAGVRAFLRRPFASRGPWRHHVVSDGKPAEAWYRPLTKREAQVAELILAGSTDREIARIIDSDVRVANKHVMVIMHKLGVNRRRDIAAWVAQHRPG